MEVAIIGLGLIGASFAKALKNKGLKCAGFDLDPHVMREAQKDRLIKEEAVPESLVNYDVVIVCLPPRATLAFLQTNKEAFKKNAVVFDVSGIKEYIAQGVAEKAPGFIYVGAHPMAGKEVGGYENASANLFLNKNFVIVPPKDCPDEAVETVREIARLAGFTTLIETDAAEHDRMIAYTSQLPHLISNAYVQSMPNEGIRGFTGGSYEDLSRVAVLDETLWSDLFLINKELLLKEVDLFLEKMQQFRKDIADADEEKLKRHLKEGKELKQRIKESAHVKRDFKK